MKKALLAILLPGLALPAASFATVFAYDSFEEYAPGQVESGANGTTGVGLNGGVGWGGAYDVNTTVKSLVQIEDRSANPVLYSNGEISIDGGLRALRTYDTANASALLVRPLELTLTPEQPVYFSFLFRTNNQSPLANQDFIQLGFDNSATATNPRISIGANTEDVGGTLLYRFFARTTTTATNSSFSATPEIAAATTYLLVGRLTGNPTGNFNQVDLFVNPATLQEPGTPQASFALNSGFRMLSHFVIRTAFLDNGDAYVIDELRVGSDYISVIPEPSSIALLLTGTLLYATRRRRQ